MKPQTPACEKWKRFGNGALVFVVVLIVIAVVAVQFNRQINSTHYEVKEDAVTIAVTPVGGRMGPLSLVEVRTPTRTLKGRVVGSFYPQQAVTAYYRLDQRGEAEWMSLVPRQKR